VIAGAVAAAAAAGGLCAASSARAGMLAIRNNPTRIKNTLLNFFIICLPTGFGFFEIPF
jgi:hypothetical protein